MYVHRRNILFSSVLKTLLFALKHLFTGLVGKHLYVLNITSILPRPSYNTLCLCTSLTHGGQVCHGFPLWVWPKLGISPLDSQHGSRSPSASVFGFNLQLVCLCVSDELGDLLDG